MIADGQPRKIFVRLQLISWQSRSIDKERKLCRPDVNGLGPEAYPLDTGSAMKRYLMGVHGRSGMAILEKKRSDRIFKSTDVLRW